MKWTVKLFIKIIIVVEIIQEIYTTFWLHAVQDHSSTLFAIASLLGVNSAHEHFNKDNEGHGL